MRCGSRKVLKVLLGRVGCTQSHHPGADVVGHRAHHLGASMPYYIGCGAQKMCCLDSVLLAPGERCLGHLCLAHTSRAAPGCTHDAHHDLDCCALLSCNRELQIMLPDHGGAATGLRQEGPHLLVPHPQDTKQLGPAKESTPAQQLTAIPPANVMASCLRE